jgi:hypothetical protein
LQTASQDSKPLDGINELLALDLKARSYSDRAHVAMIAARGCRTYVRVDEPGKALQCAQLLYKLHDDKSRYIRRMVTDIENLLNVTYGVA